MAVKDTQIALFLALVFSIVAAGRAFAEPKAYEVVKYKGRVAGLKIAFDYGNGYPEASEVRVTDPKSGKTTRFGLDGSGELHFVSNQKGSGEKTVIVKMGMDDQPPPKLEGTYTADGKTIAFTLVQQ